MQKKTKKTLVHLLDFFSPADKSVKIKESENNDKYMNFDPSRKMSKMTMIEIVCIYQSLQTDKMRYKVNL